MANQTGAAEKSTEFASIVGWADQVHAAVLDVKAAWDGFRYGPRPESNESAGLATERDADRLNATGYTLQDAINHLRELADSIRSRS